MGQGGWGTPTRVSPQWRREPGTVSSQGLTRGTEGLLHQAHLHHLQGQTSQMTPSISRAVPCLSALQPWLPAGPSTHSPPQRVQTSGRSPHRGCIRKRGWSGSGCAEQLALWPRDPHAGRGQCWLTATGTISSALPPMGPSVPNMAAQGTLHKEARSWPLQCWERACMREGSPAPLWGHGSSARQEGWTHMRGRGEGQAAAQQAQANT